MFQSFYDTENNRFFIAPLRCGSSYTDKLANALGWQELRDCISDLEDDDKIPSEINHIKSHQGLQILTLLKSKKYKDSEFITFIRNPFTRYLSAANMILGSDFGAPAHVSSDELEVLDKFLSDPGHGGVQQNLRDTPYKDVDKKISRVFANSINTDFTLEDDHLIPVLTMQLSFYLFAPDRVKLVPLQEMTDFYKQHYVPGENVQPDFYELLSSTKRKNSEQPATDAMSVYKRFLSHLPQYNNVVAKDKKIKNTFSNFIQYDIDAWDLIESDWFNVDNAQSLLGEMMEEPYFYLRHKKLFQYYMGASELLGMETHIFNKAVRALPGIHEQLIKNSWVNLDIKSFWNQ